MKVIFFKTTLTLLNVLIVFSLYAQTTLVGKVINEAQEPVSFANILLLQSTDTTLIKGVVTNLEGEFQIIVDENISTDAILQASMIGYQPKYHKINIISNQVNSIQPLILSENATVLEGVEVVSRKPLYTQEIDRMVVNVQNSVTSAGGNALEILSKSPGIQVDQANNAIAVMGKQGVIIMINGKRSRMDLQALMQLLGSMPADNIQKIEIITTPPANFDAEGNAGIINIVLVKNMEDGFNGNLGGNFGYGVRPKGGINTNFNFRQGKVNVYGDYSFNHELIQAYTQFGNTIRFNDLVTQTSGYSDRPATQVFHNGRLGLDYQWSDKTIVGILFSGYSTLWKLDAETDITTTSNLNPTFYENLHSVEKNHWLHGMANFSLTHQFNDNEKLDVNYDYLHYIDHNPTDYNQSTFDEANTLLSNEQFQSRKRTPINIQVAKIDYDKKVNDKWRYEIGAKATTSNFTNDISVAYLLGENWAYDLDYTNIFNLEERIAALYFSSDYQLDKKTTLKAGLRYEYFTAHLTTETDANLVNRKSGNFFPSLFVSHQINENNLVQMAYSRRIQRPNFDQLAPALFFFGPNTILSGNPSIQQTFTDNIKLDYRHKAYSFSLEYNYADAPIAYGQPLVLEEKNQFVIQAANMDSRQMVTGTVSLPFELANWWTTRLNMNGYWINQNPIIDDQVIARDNWTYGVYLSNDIKLPKDYNLQVGGNYYSAFQYGLGDVPVRWNLNVGVQKTFKDVKVTLNWNDIFNTGSFWDMRINQPQLNRVSRFYYDLEGSVIRLSMSYKFGKKDLKTARQRSTGSEEERGRVN